MSILGNAISSAVQQVSSKANSSGSEQPTNETFAQKVRRISREQNWSEDFQRFSDADINAWQSLWDDSRQRFRSENAPPGSEGQAWTYVEKPTESVTDPQGNVWDVWGNQSGVNVTAMQAGGGGGGRGGAAAPAKPLGAATGQVGSQLQLGSNELQNVLLNVFNQRGGIFGTNQPAEGASSRAGTEPVKGVSLTGGGLWWGGQDSNIFGQGTEKPAGGGGGGGSEQLGIADAVAAWKSSMSGVGGSMNMPATPAGTPPVTGSVVPPTGRTALGTSALSVPSGGPLAQMLYQRYPRGTVGIV